MIDPNFIPLKEFLADVRGAVLLSRDETYSPLARETARQWVEEFLKRYTVDDNGARRIER
jgi:hypothetical protein